MKEIDIARELKRIAAMGFVTTLKPADTGIGFTLETLLGLRATNKRGVADFTYEGIPTELKAQRSGSSSMVTLFTGEAGFREYSDVELVRRYGYENGQGRRALKVTLSSQGFIKQRLKLDVDSTRGSVVITDTAGSRPWAWDFHQIELKLGQLVYVKADTQGSGKNEEFHYNWAILLSGLDAQRFFGLIESGEVTVDLRVHVKLNGAARNHGTAFRIRNFEQLERCYQSVRELLPDC